MVEIISLVLSIIAVITSIISALVVIQQTRILRQTNMLPVLIDLFKEFRSAEFKEHNRFIYNHLKQEIDPKITGFSNLPEAPYNHVVPISHFFDNLGLLVASGIVDKNLVLSFMGGPIISTWNILEPYIKQERIIRGGVYQDHFEHLTALALANSQGKIMQGLKLKKVIR